MPIYRLLRRSGNQWSAAIGAAADTTAAAATTAATAAATAPAAASIPAIPSTARPLAQEPHATDG